jgi:hypothetical protein
MGHGIEAAREGLLNFRRRPVHLRPKGGAHAPGGIMHMQSELLYRLARRHQPLFRGFDEPFDADLA